MMNMSEAVPRSKYEQDVNNLYRYIVEELRQLQLGTCHQKMYTATWTRTFETKYTGKPETMDTQIRNYQQREHFTALNNDQENDRRELENQKSSSSELGFSSSEEERINEYYGDKGSKEIRKKDKNHCYQENTNMSQDHVEKFHGTNAGDVKHIHDVISTQEENMKLVTSDRDRARKVDSFESVVFELNEFFRKEIETL